MNVTQPGPGSPANLPAGPARTFAAVPKSPAYRIANARVPVDLAPAVADRAAADRLAACDIVVDGGRVAMLRPVGTVPVAADLPTVDLAAASSCRASSTCTPISTRATSGRARRIRTAPSRRARRRSTPTARRTGRADDVRARMDFALRCAYAHGTGALRTHLDSLPPQHAISWPVFAEMREHWNGRIELQAVALFPIDARRRRRAAVPRASRDTVARHGGILGGVTFIGSARTRRPSCARPIVPAGDRQRPRPRFPRRREPAPASALARAHRRGGAAPPLPRPDRRRPLLLAGARRRAEDARAPSTGSPRPASPSSRCRCATCICRTASPGRTPRWRGVTLLHELKPRRRRRWRSPPTTPAIPFYAYGDLDMLEVFREATRILHLDHPVADWPMRRWRAPPAEIMRPSPSTARIAVGPGRPTSCSSARARWTELLCPPAVRPHGAVVAGRPIDTTLPDYRELDASDAGEPMRHDRPTTSRA